MSQIHEENGRNLQKSETTATTLLPDSFVAIAVQDPDLSQEQIAQILAQRAAALAQLPPATATSDLLQLLLFQLNGGHYAIDVVRVREIFPYQPLTLVPRTPDFVAGVFSARGRLISVVDLGILLGLSATAVAPETKIVIVANDDIEVGFLADRVEDVTMIFSDSLEPTLANQTSAQAHFTRGISAGLTAVLEIDTILNDPRLIINEEL